MVDTQLSQREKAAILLISLGETYAAKIYKYLTEEEIEVLTLAITTTKRVTSDVRERVLQEFYETCVAQKYISEGGIDYARGVLKKALGEDKAMALVDKLSSTLQVRPFEFIRKADPMQIYNLVTNENPQTTALLLSYIEPKQAAQVITNLAPEIQTDVVMRMANMGSVMPEYIKEVERILEKRLASLGLSDQTAVGGIDAVVKIINAVDRGTERSIMQNMAIFDSELAQEISNRMFVFEDIVKLTSASIQRVLKEVDNSDLTIALKATSEEVTACIMSNLSKRLQEMIQDDISTMGPVRVRDVEEAQQKIVNIVRVLEDAGEIIVSRGEGDDIIV